ncbi:MAG: hypothetical protein IKW03_02440 [Clostridia bacterium]|nr:hypothetical protein [Clostridia bacterium]
MTNIISKKSNAKSSALYMTMLSIICLAIFVVTLIAFATIESNIHAVVILTIGCIMTTIIFFSGRFSVN